MLYKHLTIGSGFLYRYKCSEEIVTISAMLSVNSAVFYRPKVSYTFNMLSYPPKVLVDFDNHGRQYTERTGKTMAVGLYGR